MRMRTIDSCQPAASMKVVVLALCLALVVGDHDTTSEPDIFCRAVSIGLNPVFQNCQTLKNEASALLYSESTPYSPNLE